MGKEALELRRGHSRRSGSTHSVDGSADALRPFFQMYTALAKHGQMSLDMQCEGDLWSKS